eukprot:440374_1
MCVSGEYQTCDMYQKLLKFITNYSNTDCSYVTILSQLDSEKATQNIIMPAIKQISNDDEKHLLYNLFGFSSDSDEVKISSNVYERITLLEEREQEQKLEVYNVIEEKEQEKKMPPTTLFTYTMSDLPESCEKRTDENGEAYFIDTQTGEWYRVTAKQHKRIDTNEKLSIITAESKQAFDDQKKQMDLGVHTSDNDNNQSVNNTKPEQEKQMPPTWEELKNEFDDAHVVAPIKHTINLELSNMIYITEEEFERTLKTQNCEISSGTINMLYRNIIHQMDTFVNQKQCELLGSSFETAMICWNHVLKLHIDDVDVEAKFECKELNCVSNSRHSLRKSEKTRLVDYEAMSNIALNNLNDHAKHMVLLEAYYEREFDSIHCNILHAKQKKHRASAFQNKSKQSQMTADIYEEEKHNYFHDSIASTNETINRYTTDIGLYDFGIDHQHQYTGPSEGNICLKLELSNTDYVSYNAWKSVLIKAFQKYKLVSNDRRFRSKQFSEDYNIGRGDQIGVHHLLCICFYTDFTALCKEYRSSYQNKTYNDQVETSYHQKFYFLSRFLFEAINFFGNPMKHTDTIFHGLNQQLLFKKFTAYFNAPMSTTPDQQVAINFAAEAGIILQLRNGNKTINPNYIISKFQANQPRYLNVNWISAHNHENEWLFFGDSIIFEVINIKHKEIPANTLKQLNLLQRLITNKPIEWKNEQKRSVALATKLETTRKTMKYFDFCDEIDSVQEYLMNDQDINDTVVNKFLQWFTINEYDGDALIVDINGDECQSNFYEFLSTFDKETYFTIVREICAKQEEELITQRKQKYYIKLFHFFCISQTEFVSIQEPFKIPSHLAEQLFIDKNNKKAIS